MSLINRRQGLWTLAGGALAATVIGTRAAAQILAKPTTKMETLAVVEKNEGRVAFYAVPGGKRVGVVPLGTQPHEIVADLKEFGNLGRGGVRLQAALCALELLMPVDPAP